METGNVVRIVHKQNFGFIAPSDNSEDVFFDSGAAVGQLFHELKEGQKVVFDIEPDPTEPTRSRAANIRPG